ncbi:MAG: MaoC family dehydratase [Desulfarculus sp.]|nr:MaoC family dehydratase [Desulfarculus sp.]
MSQMRRQAVAGIQAGDSFQITRTFGQAETLAFGGLTRDYNPVHYDQEFCAGKGLDGLICHGLLVAAMICEVGGQIAWLASGMEFRFRRPVYFGDTITCRLVITKVDKSGRAEAQATYTNQHGQVVQEGRISGYLPSAADQRRLGDMLEAGDPTNPLA